MVKYIKTAGFSQYLTDGVVDGIYTGAGEEPTEEELRKIEAEEERVKKRKSKFVSNKMFGKVLYSGKKKKGQKE